MEEDEYCERVNKEGMERERRPSDNGDVLEKNYKGIRILRGGNWWRRRRRRRMGWVRGIEAGDWYGGLKADEEGDMFEN